LVKVADFHTWKKKTYNNAISALRRAFEFGYRDYPEKRDPATALNSARIGKKDRPVIDPFSIPEAERLIAALHRDWGEAQGNCDEFRFFTGLRPPPEWIALLVADYDARHRTLSVTTARVAGVDRRYRKPYAARHSSESWNLMIGRNPLSVAKRHGHSTKRPAASLGFVGGSTASCTFLPASKKN
jgi:integrase